ncbi:hypothetical protein [Alteromonas phage ZP6]|uniref:Uncharacterized protein n=1 Tax=Alteromonas phage ZP6 TaxID=2492447 RepID=A0A3S9U887_9CAUD|nr:hypothetical protein PQC03_gp34 [Alteromonas phage ZP6]AZS06537.1 hypothetical protein [Alteromonas phage ZP6]
MSTAFAKYKAKIREAAKEGLSRNELGRKSGVCAETITAHLNRGRVPSILIAETILNTLGYEIVIRKRKKI